MTTAYEKKWPLYLSTKNTILKKYDGRCLHLYMLLLSGACLIDNWSYYICVCVCIVIFCGLAGLRTFSRRSMKLAGNQNLRLLEYGEFPSCVVCSNLLESSLSVILLSNLAGMSIVLLMTWLRMRLRVKEAMCGLARITMEMCRVIS